jgi:hypothetical protein
LLPLQLTGTDASQQTPADDTTNTALQQQTQLAGDSSSKLISDTNINVSTTTGGIGSNSNGASPDTTVDEAVGTSTIDENSVHTAQQPERTIIVSTTTLHAVFTALQHNRRTVTVIAYLQLLYCI